MPSKSVLFLVLFGVFSLGASSNVQPFAVRSSNGRMVLKEDSTSDKRWSGRKLNAVVNSLSAEEDMEASASSVFDVIRKTVRVVEATGKDGVLQRETKNEKKNITPPRQPSEQQPSFGLKPNREESAKPVAAELAPVPVKRWKPKMTEGMVLLLSMSKYT